MVFEKQGNRKELNTRWRIFWSAVGSDIASREGSESRTVAEQLQKRDKSQTSMWTTCSVATKRKGKR